uniref:BED-type domain-containing protein n=1 Tax=Grammatophora oceanica TaxID=210454 RepID=A0A7S1UWA2_9STRA|mmetsp:Transcript_26785/g.39159  ORF Transcript_26785/g.39159 Transcript_26785/m.39159 type:complete len:355 (+) Transcript_26785:239-1303(+)|eukprot:CAMPEP_0194027692 /NCGR_PEP_ID=MMETSP0009_2-20130614/1795_1 /TAXON_ID=210454 /ORGANISM="Grammatophora oceanica, Strain CCMP 410" /LENGTH=354 /DNA_ID=CAMNT_0038666841 /DNA_START=233 /DNA_END=1297 /DNA_ORIENTATION=-
MTKEGQESGVDLVARVAAAAGVYEEATAAAAAITGEKDKEAGEKEAESEEAAATQPEKSPEEDEEDLVDAAELLRSIEQPHPSNSQYKLKKYLSKRGVPHPLWKAFHLYESMNVKPDKHKANVQYGCCNACGADLAIDTTKGVGSLRAHLRIYHCALWDILEPPESRAQNRKRNALYNGSKDSKASPGRNKKIKRSSVGPMSGSFGMPSSRNQVIKALRKVCEKELITTEQKRILLTDIIKNKQSDTTSILETAYDLLLETSGTTKHVGEDDGKKKDHALEMLEQEFADQCRHFAADLAKQEEEGDAAAAVAAAVAAATTPTSAVTTPSLPSKKDSDAEEAESAVKSETEEVKV